MKYPLNKLPANLIGLACMVLVALAGMAHADNDPDIDKMPMYPGLQWLKMLDVPAAPGKAVLEQVDAAPFGGTGLKHKLYLPTDWVAGKKYPVLVEYLGNNGLVKNDIGAAYGLTGGKGIIVLTLPFVNADMNDTNQWWGDLTLALDYAKKAIRQVESRWGGDSTRLVYAGFSRGSIACNYIGLHDDEMAKLWKGMVCLSVYDDGSYNYGMSNADKKLAATRLQRLGNRPQLVLGEYKSATNADLSTITSYTSMDKAIVDFDLKPRLELEGTRKWILDHYPQGNFTFVNLHYYEHSPNYFMHDIPERKIAVDWLSSVLAMSSSSSVVSSSSSVTSSSTASSSSSRASSSSEVPVSVLSVQPNPFTQTADLVYTLSGQPTTLQFIVYDARGNKVRDFLEQNPTSGENRTWLKDGHQLGIGMYLVKMLSSGRVVGTCSFSKK